MYQIKTFWLKASVLYEQLLSSVPYATVYLCTLHTEQSIYYFDQKLTFFSKLDKFQHQKLFSRDFSYPTYISQLGLKFRHVCQLWTKVQFYRAVGTKSSLQFKAFSPDTEVIGRELVIEILDKPIILDQGQIMLSKVPESHIIV